MLLSNRLEILSGFCMPGAADAIAAPIVGKVIYYANYMLLPTAPRILDSRHYVFRILFRNFILPEVDILYCICVKTSDFVFSTCTNWSFH